MINIDCPVCSVHKEIRDSIVCDNCGWLHIFYVNKMPDNIHQYLSKKHDSIKKQLGNINDLEKKIEELNKENKRLNRDLESQRHKYYVEKSKLDVINKNIEKEKNNPLMKFNEAIYRQEIATIEEKTKKLNSLITNSRQKYSNKNSLLEIQHSLKNNELKIKVPFITKPISLSDLVVGVSIKKDIQLVSEADFIFKIELGGLKPGIEESIQIEQLNFRYQSYSIGFLKASDTQYFTLKIDEK
jgi:hypothetical protein